MSKYAKALVSALVSIGGEAVTAGLISGTAGKWCAIIFPVLATVGVFAVPNASPNPAK